MTFQETMLSGAFVVAPEVCEDERGFFMRMWCEREFAAHGLNPRLAQASLSYNGRRGTTRGLHYQAAPYQEAKVVRCIRGAIYDVIVDLRPDSPTYLRWVAATLTAENRLAIYVPEGFGHGFQTLKDHTEVLYQISEFHTPQAEAGARFDDPAFAIAWPEARDRVISAKDLSWPPFSARNDVNVSDVRR